MMFIIFVKFNFAYSIYTVSCLEADFHKAQTVRGIMFCMWVLCLCAFLCLLTRVEWEECIVKSFRLICIEFMLYSILIS